MDIIIIISILSPAIDHCDRFDVSERNNTFEVAKNYYIVKITPGEWITVTPYNRT